MCFFSSPTPAAPAAVSSAPVRSLASSSARSARLTALTAKGSGDTIATTPLGDTGFGSRVKRPTFLGQTSPAY